MKLNVALLMLVTAVSQPLFQTQTAGATELLELRHSYLPAQKKLILDWDDHPDARLQYTDDLSGSWQSVVGATAPYQAATSKPHRFYRLGSVSRIDHDGEPDDLAGSRSGQETFAARAESDLGVWRHLSDSDWMCTRGQGWTRIRSGEVRHAPKSRSMSGHFLVEQDNTPVAIFFSAEAYVRPAYKRMFVRAIVDGKPLDPKDIVFTAGTASANPETRSFIFTTHVDAGLHTLELEWLVDREATGYIRDAAFLIRQGPAGDASRRFVIDTPPSGPQAETLSQAWSSVPGLSGSVQTKAGDSLAISVSAESYALGGGALFLRALVDGVPAAPSDVLFAKGNDVQSRLMTFVVPKPAPGVHNVQIEWMVSGGGSAFVGDRSLVLAATPTTSPNISQVVVTVPSGPTEKTTSKSFAQIPGMKASGAIPFNAEVAVLFSAEAIVPNGDSIFVRMLINGITMSDAEVQLAESHAHVGTHSHLFSTKHITFAGGPVPAASTISLEWRSENGNQVEMGDRTMTILVKPASVPDLAEPIPFGGGNSPIEAAIGTRKVLAILFDPGREDISKPNLNTTKAYLFGPVIGLKHYYNIASAGKYNIESALGADLVLGWYDGTNDVSNYFGGGDGCDAGDPANGQDTRRREAIQRASQDFDFASCDLNGDGVLDPQTELAILLVMPDDGNASPSGKVRSVYNNDCSPLTVAGLVVPRVAEWLTDMHNGDYIVAVHEMAHLLLNLDDSYVSDEVNTRARRLSLMDGASDQLAPHIDPMNKMALGWVTPTIVKADGNYALQDVKKSHDVLILPRLPGIGLDEFFILENRQDAANDALYDRDILDSGIAVWHVIHDHTQNGTPPVCQDPVSWAEQTDNWNARRGNRVLRPHIISENETSLWNDEYYDLLDNVLLCPFLDGGDPSNRRNALRWADSTESGYNVLNWSKAADTMTFQVVTP